MVSIQKFKPALLVMLFFMIKKKDVGGILFCFHQQ